MAGPPRSQQVLLTARLPGELVAEARSLLSAHVDLRYEPAHPGWPEAQLAALLADVDAVLAGGDRFTHDSMASAGRLRVVARLGVGFDLVDVDAASKLGIHVTTAPGANAAAVADYVMGALIALARDIPARSAALRKQAWEPTFGLELAELTLGLIGFGAIGSAVAMRARAFGMSVQAFDAYVPGDRMEAAGVRGVGLDALFRTSDVVSLHVPSLPDTRHLVNAERLALMPTGSVLVNSARGDLVDEGALFEALESGHLLGAALDVFATEPPTGVSQILASHPAVIATPHIAGSTRLSARRMMGLAVESVLEALAGRVPPRSINQDRVIPRGHW